ncbi:hypothetical protein C7I86_11180 [Synechocystis sp. IPPAS B-1465]|nr:hypothetical protein C7I86_11180 [Synechocystis sp. IPPAS B-1465]
MPPSDCRQQLAKPLPILANFPSKLREIGGHLNSEKNFPRHNQGEEYNYFFKNAEGLLDLYPHSELD